MASSARPDRASDAREVLLGRVVGAHGIQGELRVQSWTDPAEAILDYRPWLIDHAGERRTIEAVRGRAVDKGLIVRLPGVDDRDGAERLKGAEIRVLRAALPPPGPGQYYWVDLEGLDVFTVDGVALGRVEKVVPTGANEVLEVRGDRLRYLPFVLDEYVKSIDLDAGRLVIDWDPDF